MVKSHLLETTSQETTLQETNLQETTLQETTLQEKTWVPVCVYRNFSENKFEIKSFTSLWINFPQIRLQINHLNLNSNLLMNF